MPANTKSQLPTALYTLQNTRTMGHNQNNSNIDDLDFNNPNDFYTLLTGFIHQESPPVLSMNTPDDLVSPLELAIFDFDAAQELLPLNAVGATSAIPDTSSGERVLPIPESTNPATARPTSVNDQLSIANSSPGELLSDLPHLDKIYTVDGSLSESAVTLPGKAVPTTLADQMASPQFLSAASSSNLQISSHGNVNLATLCPPVQVNQGFVDELNGMGAFADLGYTSMYPRTGTPSGFYLHQQQLHHQQQQFPLLPHLQYPSLQYPHYQHPQHQLRPLHYAHPQLPQYQLPHLEQSHLQHSYPNCYCSSQYQQQPRMGRTLLETGLPFSYYPPSVQAHPIEISGMKQYPQDSVSHLEAPSRRQPQRYKDELEDVPAVRRISSRKRSESEPRKPVLQKVKHFLRSSTRLGMDRKQDQPDPQTHSSSLAPIYASPGYSVSAPNLSLYTASTPSSSTFSLELTAPAAVKEVDLAKSSPQSLRRITDSAHFRSRNAFFIFRGFVSRLQTEAAAANPDLSRSQAQTKVSMSCGKLWGLPCIEPCTPLEADCVNCRTRSLFLESASNLKHRQEVIQRQLKFPSSSSLPSLPLLPCFSSDRASNHGEVEYGVEGEAISTRRITSISIVDAFDWAEFRELYPHTDLFRWYRERSQTGGTEVDLQEMKRVWIENETNYEKAFVEGARKRIAQEVARKHRR